MKYAKDRPKDICIQKLRNQAANNKVYFISPLFLLQRYQFEIQVPAQKTNKCVDFYLFLFFDPKRDPLGGYPLT